ncbi:MAG: ferrous iron transport protein A [Alphaproteobacteria bacterium]
MSVRDVSGSREQGGLGERGDAMTLADLVPGERASIGGIVGDAAFRRRLSAMGLVKGHEVYVDLRAPLGDPRLYTLLGYQLCLRNEDARKIYLDRQG